MPTLKLLGGCESCWQDCSVAMHSSSGRHDVSRSGCCGVALVHSGCRCSSSTCRHWQLLQQILRAECVLNAAAGIAAGVVCRCSWQQLLSIGPVKVLVGFCLRLAHLKRSLNAVVGRQ
jgi:hypothetical protein